MLSFYMQELTPGVWSRVYEYQCDCPGCSAVSKKATSADVLKEVNRDWYIRDGTWDLESRAYQYCNLCWENRNQDLPNFGPCNVHKRFRINDGNTKVTPYPPSWDESDTDVDIEDDS